MLAREGLRAGAPRRYSYPLGTPYFSDRARHLAHHRLVGRSEDPDWTDYERGQFHSPAGVARYLIGQLLGEKVVWRLLAAVGRQPAAGERRRVAADPRENAAIAACQLLLFALFAGFGRWWEYFVLWILPLTTLASFLVSFRAFLEHASARGPDATPEERLYDFAPGAVGRWFVSPCLFHLHALHHAYPGVPYFRLPRLRRELEDRGVAYATTPRPGYLGTLRGYLATARSGAARS